VTGNRRLPGPPEASVVPADAPADERRGFWMSAIALLLIVWEPVGLAMVASGAISRLSIYGVPAYALLAFRMLTAGIGIAAGLGLWERRSHGPRLARLWVGLSALGVMLTFATPYFPDNRLPGTTIPTLLAILAYHAALLTYLVRSARIRRVSSSPTARLRP